MITRHYGLGGTIEERRERRRARHDARRMRINAVSISTTSVIARRDLRWLYATAGLTAASILAAVAAAAAGLF